MKEQDIIQKYFTRNSSEPSIVKGVGDDAAILQASAEHQLVVTTDTLIEDIHFIKNTPAYFVGYKLMATNISDVAAMGATPKWATLNLNLKSISDIWLQEFSKGLFECADKHHVALIGGDTTRSSVLSMSVQLIGNVPENQATKRSTAQSGDNIYVTGVIGKAAEAFNILQQHQGNHEALTPQQIDALYRPNSRVALAAEWRTLIHAAIDISDGLLHELNIICSQSNVGAQVNIDDIPTIETQDNITSLTFGEDYELLITADKNNEEMIFSLAEKHHCSITKIGTITQSPKVQLHSAGKEVPFPDLTGYDHFQSS